MDGARARERWRTSALSARERAGRLGVGDTLTGITRSSERSAGRGSTTVPPFIRSIELTNFRGIAQCNVQLGSLRILVGPNGAGKSSFLDAFGFLRDATRDSLDHAIRNRGGITEVRRRSRGHPTHFSIRIRFRLPSGSSGHYSFRIGARSGGRYRVQREECRLFRPLRYFVVENGRARGTSPVLPPASDDRLYLVAAAGLPEFEELYSGLKRMGFYNLNPATIAEPQPPQPGDLLEDDGINTAAVLAELAAHAPDRKRRIEDYLRAVVPGVVGVNRTATGRQESLEFRQRVKGSADPWRFPAHTMSDGTLRALGLLVALFQRGEQPWEWVPLIGIEEPELALHPAATSVLLDALREVSTHTQVLVTSHSPDLLDHKDIGADELISVVSRDGNTIIGQPGRAAVSALRDQLYTAGELLRMDQLEPEQANLR